MSRATIERHWTPDEVALADKIILAVDAAGGRLVGALTVARAVGLPYTVKARQRSLEVVYDVMPLAAMMAPIRVGKALVVQRDRTYRITDDIDAIHRDVAARAKAMHTKATRMAATMSPLAGLSDPVSILMTDLINQTLAGLDPDKWNPLISKIERGGTV